MALTNITADHMKYLPTTSLTAMGNTAAAQKGKKNNILARKQARLDKLTGKGNYVSPAGGRSAVKGFGSLENASKTAEQQSYPVKSTTNFFADSMQDPDTADKPLFSNPDWDDADAKLKMNEIISEMDSFYGEINIDPDALGRVNNETMSLKSEIAALQIEIDDYEKVLRDIGDTISARIDDPSLEPDINDELMTGTESASNFKTYVEDNIVFPFLENQERFDSLINQLMGSSEDLPAPMFDLVYGPPISIDGQFILSEDGLYYDSRTGGLPDVTGVTIAEEDWDLQIPPNIGGKGKVYGQTHLDGVFNTILDYSFDSSGTVAGFIVRFQETDDVLETFEKDKAYHIGVVSSQILELKNSGYAEDSALVVNYYNSIGALASTYDFKIKKRKKQLQLVALFGMDVFNFSDLIENTYWLETLGPDILLKNESPFEEEPTWQPTDRVPINDFTFLKGKPVDLSLEDQGSLVLFSEDLDDTILPIQPKFLVSPPQKFSYLEKFSLDTIAPAEWVRIEGSDGVSGTGSFVKSLRDGIITSSLVLGYNFLRPGVVEASSVASNLDNIIPDSGGKLDGQLVGVNTESVFPSGLSIPYLRGTRYDEGGSYVRLPNEWDFVEEGLNLATGRLDDLTYKRDVDPLSMLGGGFSFDFWVYMPNFTMTDAHRYRLILSNENCGDAAVPANTNMRLSNRTGDDLKTKQAMTHGLMLGYRDKGGSTSPSGLQFSILPTVSQNENTVNGYAPSVCIAEKYTDFNESGYPVVSSVTELGMSIEVSDTTEKGSTIIDASSSFVNMSVVFDYFNDAVSVYQDGYLLSTSSIGTTFNPGLDEHLFLPTLISPNFDHRSSFLGLEDQGPRVQTLPPLAPMVFTPWILGGGFTDGIATSGFLGANTNDLYNVSGHGAPFAASHGQHVPVLDSNSRSGLNGFIGSFKIYDEPLTSSEVLSNYKAQQAYFKNISIP